MTESIEKGTWVEIHRIVLLAGDRAPQVPLDTQQVPLEARVKGFLIESACLGDEAEIETPSGRRLLGILVEINPAYCHTFGHPIPELSSIGREVRYILWKKGTVQ